MGTHIVGNNLIQAKSGLKEGKKIEQKDFEGIFSDAIPKIADSPGISAKPNLKENWEQVKRSSPLKNNPDDSKTIRPSRGKNETYFGGSGALQGDNSIFDPEVNIKELEYTKHIREAGKEKKRKQEEKHMPSPESKNEWEQVKPALKTSDVPVTSSGIIPNRSSLKQSELPDIKPKWEQKTIKKEVKSKEAGIKSAEIKSKLDQIAQDREANISNNWEEEALRKIEQASKRKIEVPELGIKIAKAFLPPTPRDNNSLSGIFKVPEDPSKVEEKPIKRDSIGIKEKRKTRSEDRSWEKVLTPKKTRI